MGRLVEPEEYDPKKHWRWGPIMIDKTALWVVPLVLFLWALIFLILWLAGKWS